jgi:hypothetical protein
MVQASTAMPFLAVGTAKRADSSATRRSQAIASWVPAPMAGPLTAAMIGTGTRVRWCSIP